MSAPVARSEWSGGPQGWKLLDQTVPRETASAQVSLGHLTYRIVKRAVDLGGSAVLLILLAPMLLAIGVAIYLDSGLPIIYRSRRLGHHGRPIVVYKFRTMRDSSHHHLSELLSASEERRLEYTVNRKLRHDPRRTRVGSFLRKTSLDELPQLWNVLRGEMSLIGPRPYFPDELAGRLEADEILMVRPGITGLWQVNGRSERTFEERLSLERRYVRARGFVLDSKILVLTVRAVVSGRGAY
jgi:lipopolysaccharide/colanic/teichoic acid biosynthesis glycosyltransferase